MASGSLEHVIVSAFRERTRSCELVARARALLAMIDISLEDARAARDLAQTLREAGRLASKRLVIGAHRSEPSPSS
jgi:hypothetical protein